MAKIMVVDDAAFMRMMVKNALAQGGYTDVCEASDGNEAVQMYTEQQPQLVLMDITMPVMNGYEATSEIRKFSATVPIIGLTARAFSDDEQEGYDCGMTEYMTKPINIVQLRMHISKLLG